MSHEYDFLTFIGRFQPFHDGHKAVIEKALTKARFVNIAIGSACAARSIRNPFTYSERLTMISENFPGGNIGYTPILDHPYNDAAWVKNVTSGLDSWETAKMGLIGHAKDHSSYYLKLFPQWGNIDSPGYNKNGELLSATDIRNDYFLNCTIRDVPKETRYFLEKFMHSSEYDNLQEEFLHVQKYKEQWKNSPYPPIFFTVDSVCVQAGHVLLVTRKSAPGKGLLALPGGFINEYEDTFEATIRELQEETSIDVPEMILRGKAKERRLFDYPYRSDRGRTITYATLFDLNSELDRRAMNDKWAIKETGKPVGMTKVKGGDDAAKAGWYNIADLNPSLLFEDHYAIIQAMLGLG